MDVEVRPSEATDYRILEVNVSGERFPGNTINLRNMVNEINIYEHIDKPYLTGSIVFTDNESLSTQIGFLGAERISIIISVDTITDTDFQIEKNFIVTEVTNSVKSNDNHEVILLQLMEEKGYKSKLTRVSKSYTDTPNVIIERIMKDYLNAEVVSLGKANEANTPIKVIIPNLTPIEAATWIRTRATTIEGMPYFLFSCVADDKLRFIDLETIISGKALNPVYPYLYSDVAAKNTTPHDIVKNSYNIVSYKMKGKENQIELASQGLVSATYNFLDHTKGTFEKQTFDVNQVFQGLKNRNAFKTNQSQEILDNTTLIDGKTMMNYDTKEISMLSTTNLYTDGSANYYEAPDISSHMNKVKSLALRHFLHKSSMNITVPGRNFISDSKNVSIGNLINIKFLVNLPENNKVSKDNRKSGEYMIYAVRHHFSGKAYHAAVSCTKLTNQEEPEAG